MSKRVIGSTQVSGNLQINGQNTIRSINGINPDPNTGQVTYPLYKRSEIQGMLDMFPISRIGTMDYLPMNINGSFEGASSYSFIHEVQPVCLEDDGTMVMIRSGTNGSTSNFYYGYIQNIRSLSSLSQSDFISTNTIFKPSFFTSNHAMVEFYNTDAYELLFYKFTNSGVPTYGLSLTNGTLNTISHQNATFDTSALPNFAPVFANICGSNIYIWGIDGTVPNHGLTLILYSVPVSQVISGSSLTLTKVTGISGSTITGTSFSGAQNIKMYDSWSTLKSDGITNSLFTYTAPCTGVEYANYITKNYYVRSSNDGTKMRLMYYPTYRLMSDISYSIPYSIAFSFVFDVSTKTVTYDNTIGSQIDITATVNSGNITYNQTNAYTNSMTKMNGYNDGVLSNAGSISQTNDGYLISTKCRRSSGPTFGIVKGIVTGATPFDSLNVTTRNINSRYVLDVFPTFGSAIGENLLGCKFISNDRVVIQCAGTSNGTTFSYDTPVQTYIGTNKTFQYNSLDYGTLTGFSPSSDRSQLTNTNNQYCGLISIFDNTNTVNAYGTSFIETFKNTGGGLLNSTNYTFTGSYTMSDSVLQSVGSSVVSTAGLTGITKILSNFYYVSNPTYGNSVIVTHAYNSTTRQCTIIWAECTALLSGSTITGATIRGIINSITLNNIVSIQASTTSNRMSGCNLAYGDGTFNYVSYNSLIEISSPAGPTWYYLHGRYNPTTNSVVTNQITNTTYISGGLTSPGYVPGSGFGKYNYSKSDAQTKLVFDVYGNSVSELDNMLSGSGVVTSTLVIASQDVAEGFLVYFTQTVPIFLGGLYYELQAQTIDLTQVKANPANTTFYLYVQMNRSTKVGSYVISQVELDESLTNAYIGTIITDSTGISSIVTEKVTRFLTYRPSTTKRGSAIPTSTGVPSGSGTRWN